MGTVKNEVSAEWFAGFVDPFSKQIGLEYLVFKVETKLDKGSNFLVSLNLKKERAITTT